MIFRLQLALWLALFREKLRVLRKARRVDGAWLGRPLGPSSSHCRFVPACSLPRLPFLAMFPCFQVSDAHCTSAVNGSQLVKLWVTHQGQSRPSTFARFKYLMFCEPMSLLFMEDRLSIAARSVPSSPTGTLLIEASVFLEKGVFVMLLWKTNSPFCFLFLLPLYQKTLWKWLLNYINKLWFYHRKISESAKFKKKKLVW